ncbi:MAG: YigZ family protein [Flavobacteriaceae bacterium]|nr:YigZ family protein [Flavobacteriaceae bacterium]
MAEADQYFSIKRQVQGDIFKDKGSKFLGYAFPVSSESDVQEHLAELKKAHHSARHWCYAYQIGPEMTKYRANDDGEPNNSAGQPILGQIRSSGLTDVLVVVVRYFGGTKLGVGGLITSYKSAAKNALDEAEIITHYITCRYEMHFDYPLMNQAMQIIKEFEAEVVKRQMESDCRFTVVVKKSDKERWDKRCNPVYGLKLTEIDD